MDEQDLEQKLEGIFTDLAAEFDLSQEKTLPSLTLAPETPPVDELEQLFSDAPPAEDRSPAALEEEEKQRTRPVMLKLWKSAKTAPPEPAQPAPPKAKALVPASTPDQLATLLNSEHIENRRQAVQRLAPSQGPETIDLLLHALVDRSPEVAGLALTALLQRDEAVKQRLLALTAEHPATALHRAGERYFSHRLGQPFIYISSGPFLMGSDPTLDELTDANEQPQHVTHLGGYWLARYPLTTARFQGFVKEAGYQAQSGAFMDTGSNHPVVNVTWFDALAYCRWLSQRSGLPLTLPSEAQWEKAARGTDGRRYPWGNQPPTEQLGNFAQITRVGQYSPQGDSPYGCADMAGNAWEWTRSLYRPYPYVPTDGRERLENGDEPRVIRGLSFSNAKQFTRCAFRYSLAPHLQLKCLGFRVAISPE